MRLVLRDQFGWPHHPDVGTADCANGLVVHYDGNNQGLAGKPHSACVQYWKDTRRFHMGPKRGWRDIGYSFGVCPHGFVFEGRGWRYIQAAQPGGNATWTSVTFMTGDAEPPTASAISAFRDLRDYLRQKGLSAAISKHKVFISTDCPGPILSKMVDQGALLRKQMPKPTDPNPEEDDVRYFGQLNNGPSGTVTPISLHPGDVGSIGFVADNGIGGQPAVKIRVAVHDVKGWYVERREVDSTKLKAVVKFRDPKTTDGLSVQREDDNAVPVAWDAS